ncbi:MAG: MFS transporter [Clostridiales bacterium]|jgi:fucose permease|nr:MFS transporter [Clostridiales bacterium]
MYSLLLTIIYIAFISLGLPDSLLGSAWPVMYGQLGVPISYAGIITMIIACGTVISSLLSDRLTRRLGAGLVTAISVLMTAVALYGFSVSGSYYMLCVWAVPYGLGAGAVDAALNNYVALHYASRHMSWLHCFWGVGAALSPYIMGYSLTRGYGWNNGYLLVSVIQIVLTAILFISLPLWKRKDDKKTGSTKQSKALSLTDIIKIRGVKLVLITFFSYCALESTAGLWASSYLVEFRGFNAEMAARLASLFYLGITVGRFLSGFIADKLGDRALIRYGLIVIFMGIILIGLPISGSIIAPMGLVITGLGCAPIYPSVIHATPANFGEDKSQAVIGVQMASAYVGTTLMPPVFGFIADKINIGLYPLYLLLFAIIMIIMSERLNATV